MRTILLTIALLLCAGCASLGKRAEQSRVIIQQALDAVLPASFTGDAHFSTTITYGAFPVRVTLRCGGLKRTEKGWEWVWLSYNGSSPISETTWGFGAPTVP
jgi:hypothetical protein